MLMNSCPGPIHAGPRLVRRLLVPVLALTGFFGLAYWLEPAQPALAQGPDSQAAESTTVLYDGARGTYPDEQGLSFFQYPAGATQTLTAHGVILDTMADSQTRAGYFGDPSLTPDLNRTEGYTVTFTLQLLEEDHQWSDKDGDGTGDRAGFSLLVVGHDLYGIELGFWLNEIWAQEDGEAQPPNGTLFTHAEGVIYDTTAQTRYDLNIAGDRYRLLANGAEILSGRARNYSAFQGELNPYQAPNTLFLGDDTTSARGAIQLSAVAITTAAEIQPGANRLFLPAVWGQAESSGAGSMAGEKREPCKFAGTASFAVDHGDKRREPTSGSRYRIVGSAALYWRFTWRRPTPMIVADSRTTKTIRTKICPRVTPLVFVPSGTGSTVNGSIPTGGKATAV